MGGALARPCISYPSLFPAGTIWERFPFLLPNIVCTIVVVFSVTFGWLFVQETHPKKKHDRDRGIELGKKILKLFRRRSYADTMLYSKVEQSDFDSTDEYSPYSSEQSSPLISTQASTDAIDAISLEAEKVGADAPKKAFTPQVMLIIAGYGILA